MPYTSSGGGTLNGVITLQIEAISEIVFTDPGAFAVSRNFTLEIDALAHAAENNPYTLTCGDATGVDATKMTVSRSSSGSGCVFTVDPIDTLTIPQQNRQGMPIQSVQATFSVLFTSTGGDTHTGTYTVDIGRDTSIAYTAPDGA